MVIRTSSHCGRLTLAVAALMGIVHDAAFGDVVVAERGKPASCTVVVPEDAEPSQRYAADEFTNYIFRATGVALPVSASASGPAVRLVLVPRAVDAFQISCKDRDIVVKGGRTGVLYGVYEILERFAGCRWYASWRTVVPSRDRVALPDGFKDAQKPAILLRDVYWWDVIRHPEFAAHIRSNVPRSTKGGIDKFGGMPYRFGGGTRNCHTFATFLPPKEFADSHPEYYAEIGGKRRTDKEHPQRCEPCLTNPDVLRIVTERVLDCIRKDPGATFYGVSQNDNRDDYCRCEKCKAVDKEEGSPAGTYIRFVNAVAEAVEKEFPDVFIETLAYNYTVRPTKTKLRHNVSMCLCAMGCDESLPMDQTTYNSDFVGAVKGWGSMNPHLMIYDYKTSFTHYLAPHPCVYPIQGNIKFYRDNGVKYIFSLGAHTGAHAEFAELKAWLTAKWLWNPELPAHQLLDDFFAGYYGAAAPFVRVYFETLQSCQMEFARRTHRAMISYTGPDGGPSNEFFENASELWRLAGEAVKDDPGAAYAVRMGAMSVDYVRAMRKVKLARFADDASLSADERRQAAQRIFDRCKECPDIEFSEGRSKPILARLHELADGKCESPDDSVRESGRFEVEERYFDVDGKGKICEFVDDPAAEDGKALKVLPLSPGKYCVRFSASRIAYKQGRRYRFLVRARVEKEGDGEAFRARYRYNVWQAEHDIAEVVIPVAKASGGYAWYEVAKWKPRGGDQVQIAPGVKGKNGKSAIKALWIDKMAVEEIR